jgi:hypothetical protein
MLAQRKKEKNNANAHLERKEKSEMTVLGQGACVRL